MKYTNTHNFPQPFVDAVIKSGSRNSSDWDMSVTELIEPPYMRMLKELHGDKLEIDVSKLIRQFIGTIGHRLLELSADSDHEVEQRLFTDICGIKLSGQTDLFVPDVHEQDADHAQNMSTNRAGTIVDYKFTMSASAKKPKPEWIYQLNCYHWLYEKHGYEITAMRVLAILLDWSATKAERSENYTQVGAVMIDIPRMENIEGWIRTRIKLHQDAIEGKYVQCSDEERWHREDSWAVMKQGTTRAIKGGVFGNLPDAENLASFRPDLIVEHRPGRDLRCDLYCDVRQLCEFKNKEDK